MMWKTIFHHLLTRIVTSPDSSDLNLLDYLIWDEQSIGTKSSRQKKH